MACQKGMTIYNTFWNFEVEGMMLLKTNWIRFSAALLVLLLVTVSGGFGVFAYMALNLESFPDIEQPQTSRFYYGDGELMTTQFVENRTKVSLNEVAEEVIWATIAVEDRRFFEHNGFDLRGIFRAAFQNLRGWQITQGGSTITQQLAKNLFLSHERTWQRKWEEAKLTWQLERRLSKDEILQLYLNTIYYGHATYGIEAAAQLYFDKSAAELSLEEAALLAGLPRGPGYYSPFIDEEASRNRQAGILKLMEEEGFITPEEMEKALGKQLYFNESPTLSRESSYIVDQILYREFEEISKRDPEILQKGGLSFYSTIDAHMQAAAERILEEELPVNGQDEQGVTQPQAALVAMEPDTGKIKALVGGRSYGETMLNRVNLPRSPGSAFKPLVYAAALERGYTAAHTFRCEPISLEEEGMAEPYEPTDFGGGFHYDDLTLREALVKSCNITAVKLNQEIGGERTIEMAQKLGIKSPMKNYISAPLGTLEVTLLELTAAYAAFANGGYRVEPVLLEKATGPGGENLIDNSPRLDKVMDESVGYLLTDFLREVLQPGGTASSVSLTLDRPAAGKTGTSQVHKNVYMVGYTPDLVVGLFVGDDREYPLEETGGSLAAPLWAEFIKEASRDIPPGDFVRPGNIVQITLCPETGLIQSTNCTATGEKELFIQDTQPEKECSEEDCPHIETAPWWHWDSWW